MMIKASDEYDQIIFDYLEGNLSPNEREAFEILMSSSETLSSRTSEWKATYLTDKAPLDTTGLEGIIMTSFKKSKWHYTFNSITAAVIILSFLPMRLSDAPSTFLPTSTLNLKDSIETKDIVLVESCKSINAFAKKATVMVKVRSQLMVALPKKTQENGIISEPVVAEMPSIKTIVPLLDVPKISIPEVKVRRVGNHKKIIHRSSKERRDINRKKRNAHQKNIEKEFMKGNIPYVVPLDVTSF